MTNARTAIAIALSLSLGLGGCVTLLPKAKPVQLYHLGETAPSATPRAPGAGAPIIERDTTTFVPAAEGDRILTTRGLQAAYVAGGRWVSPASVLFDQAETLAFAGSDGSARLIDPGQSPAANVSLQLDVRTFEARYGGADAAPPTVWVVVAATLTSLTDRKARPTMTFESHKAAGEDRVGPIVDAFDAATRDALGQVVAWTDAQRVAAGLSKR